MFSTFVIEKFPISKNFRKTKNKKSQFALVMILYDLV